MDATLRGLIALVEGSNVETRCAALVVLTALGSSDDRVGRAVAGALSSPNVLVRDFALGYCERVRTPQIIPAVLPLLDAEDEAVRQRAVAILTPYGASAIGAAKPALKDAPRRRQHAIFSLCARVRSGSALDLLFGMMATDDVDLSRAACDATLGVVGQLNDRERADLLRRVTALVTAANGRRTHLVAAAKLFGALADASARALLFPMLDAREPHIVHTHALAALTQCLRGQSLARQEIDRLLALLPSDDEIGILRPAIRLLEDQAFDRTYFARLRELVDSPQPLVKRFAVGKLGDVESGGAVKSLLGYLTDDSYARRDQAIATLKAMPAARLPLMKELLACDDERKAWTLADIILLHDRSWKRDVVRALWDKLLAAVEEREDRLYTAVLHVLNALDSSWVRDQIRARAEVLRKRRRFADGARWLWLLKDTPAWDDEVRYAYAAAAIHAHRHPLGAPARVRDPALDVFRSLAAAAFPLAERLRKDRALVPEDLYYIAFALAEQRGEGRGAAVELLSDLAAKHGRTKVGRAARNKLQLLER
jgi:hypothetical protein